MATSDLERAFDTLWTQLGGQPLTAEKTCSKCGAAKRLDEFHREAKSKDGRKSSCAECACKAQIERKNGKRSDYFDNKKETRQCIVCGIEFAVYKSDAARRPALCCSPKCDSDAKRDAVYQSRNCQNCGVEFAVREWKTRQSEVKYCSRSCQREARKPAPRYCVTCGTRIAGVGKLYCSQKCRGANFAGENNPASKPKVERTCEICDTHFFVVPAVAAYGQGRFCSRRCFAMYQATKTASEGYSRCKGGKRDDLGEKYFRSGWEANYARYLNWLVDLGEIVGWEYEPDVFEFEGIKRGTTFYVPDFKITNPDKTIEYHEIKGWMDKRSRTKLNRMKKYHPDVRLILIDSDSYRKLAQDVRRFIPNWE